MTEITSIQEFKLTVFVKDYHPFLDAKDITAWLPKKMLKGVEAVTVKFIEGKFILPDGMSIDNL